MSHPLEAELLDVIAGHIARHPRTLQTRIGPSEVGTPCDRRLGHKLAGTPEVNTRDVAWKPWLGTAAHNELAMIFEQDALNRYAGGRWLCEQRVTSGQINGTDVNGSTDLFDTATGTVVDWKFTTRNKIRSDYRTRGPGQQYRTQAHAYGRGWAAKGHQVHEVAVLFFARDGEFADRYWWSEPYDERVAVDAFDRATGVAQLIESLGAAVALPLLPTDDAYCTFCPWWRPGATDLGQACPGHTNSRAATAVPGTLADAIGN